VSLAPLDAGFQGCVPKPALKLTEHCEDIYDITDAGEGVLARDGWLTAWKYLVPVGKRVVGDQERTDERLYVKVVFPTYTREAAIPRINAFLATFVIR
jgi:hypothetical protein